MTISDFRLSQGEINLIIIELRKSSSFVDAQIPGIRYIHWKQNWRAKKSMPPRKTVFLIEKMGKKFACHVICWCSVCNAWNVRRTKDGMEKKSRFYVNELDRNETLPGAQECAMHRFSMFATQKGKKKQLWAFHNQW